MRRGGEWEGGGGCSTPFTIITGVTGVLLPADGGPAPGVDAMGDAGCTERWARARWPWREVLATPGLGCGYATPAAPAAAADADDRDRRWEARASAGDEPAVVRAATGLGAMRYDVEPPPPPPVLPSPLLV